jgi:hypothetical protein
MTVAPSQTDLADDMSGSPLTHACRTVAFVIPRVQAARVEQGRQPRGKATIVRDDREPLRTRKFAA